MDRRVSVMLLAAIIVGVAFGVVCRLGDRLPEPWTLAFNTGGPWLLVAVAFGAVINRRWWSAWSGALALAAAAAGYYGYMHFGEGQANLPYLSRFGWFWLQLALAAGVVSGEIGRAWRSSNPWLRMWAAALIASALAGEGGLFLLRGAQSSKPAAVTEIAIALLLPWILLRDRRESVRATLLAAALAGFAGAGMLALIYSLRRSTM